MFIPRSLRSFRTFRMCCESKYFVVLSSLFFLPGSLVSRGPGRTHDPGTLKTRNVGVTLNAILNSYIILLQKNYIDFRVPFSQCYRVPLFWYVFLFNILFIVNIFQIVFCFARETTLVLFSIQ